MTIQILLQIYISISALIFIVCLSLFLLRRKQIVEEFFKEDRFISIFAITIIIFFWFIALPIYLISIAIGPLKARFIKFQDFVRFKRMLKQLNTLKSDKIISEFLCNSLASSLNEYKNNNYISCGYFNTYESCLIEYWEHGTDPADFLRTQWEQYERSNIRYSIAKILWTIGFTRDFIKSIKGVDKKLQGRILGAITEIAESPIKVRGNTIKPLNEDLQGFWRYRLGDHRIVYLPEKEPKNVVLMNFGPRDKIYEKV